jgi:hypothetical protein
MNENDLLHIIGKLTTYLDDTYGTYSVLEFTDDFTAEEIAIVTRAKAEYEFWNKMTTKQEVTYVFDIESNNPCCEISMK